MMTMMGNMRQSSPNTHANTNTDNSNDQKRKVEDKEQEGLVGCALNTK